MYSFEALKLNEQTNIVHSNLYKKLAIKFLGIFLFSLCTVQISAQVNLQRDSLKTERDTITVDSLSASPGNENELKSPIKYSSKDSMMFSLKTKMIFAYGDAKLGMDEMNLEAGYIKMDMDSNFFYAKSFVDQKGQETGKPVFTQGDEKYEIKTIKYNTKSKKALITDVVTEMGGGYMQAAITKMHPNKEIDLANGKFSTCDAAHPHFYIQLTKAKVIPNKAIYSGPFYFVISDIPIYPLFLPFGYFPNQTKRSSGIIIPTYGEEKNRGFFLQQGGYYFALSDYVDLTVLGEIYTSGSWGVNVRSNYKKRYKYSGNLDFSYNKVVTSEKDLKDYSKSTNFSVKLNYTRDPKSMPNASFNAAIDFRSSKFNQYNTTEINKQDPLKNLADNNTNSSIAYTKSWPSTPFHFSINGSANQNLTDSMVNLQFPTISLTMNTQHPFKKKIPTGKNAWYEQITVGFSTNMKNSVNIKSNLLFTGEALKRMSNGLQYVVPISTSLKVLKYLILAPSFNYTGRVYSSQLNKVKLDNDWIVNGDTIMNTGDVRTDTVRGIYHVYDFSFSAPLSTKLYGMVNFKKGKIMAIRHVMSPSVSFSYKPDFADLRWNYYAMDPTDSVYNKEKYNLYANGIYGSPSAGKSGSIGFGLDNNFEMKTHTGDTAAPEKKIVLLNSLGFSTSYNLAADSLKWSPISIRANTKLLKQINVSYSATVVLYDVDSLGRFINIPYYKANTGLGRFTNNNITLSGSISSETFKKKKKDEEKKNPTENSEEMNTDASKDLKGNQQTEKDKKEEGPKLDADGYSFSMPWNLSINYSFNLSNTKFNIATQKFEPITTQTVNLNGDLSLTEKWKVNGSLNYDLAAKKISNVSMSISRDLHCWQMSFNCIPFGKWQSYSFRINVKSSMLQGVEYKKQNSWADNF